MRDKERLEQLENGSSFSIDDITFLLKQARLYQISRDDTRKACHKVREENKELKQENKRYRDVIELAIHNMKGCSDLGTVFALNELERVLEGAE